MRRFPIWIKTLGLMTLAPSLMFSTTLAAPPRRIAPPGQAEATSAKPRKVETPEEAAVKAERLANQRMAEKVAAALQKANLGQENFDVQFQNGVVTLVGPVTSARNKLVAEKAAKSVRGVTKVENALQVGTPKAPAARTPSGVIPAEGTNPSRGNPRMIQQTSMQAMREPYLAPPEEGAQEAGVSGLQISQAQVSQGQPMPQGYPAVTPPPYVPSSVPAPPGYASGGSYPGGYPFMPVYDQPNLPNHAWPTYANYPNYAQVSYPKQYSASAYPYIGPFHPYPQIPLGWRKVQLEWDDGYWQLNFRPRTEKWWWFMDPRNWN